ncbi:aspartate aminotransferase family protein [Bacillus mojavensis]|uniref:aspartate aminotransferase family protein n=1 Tax=Bacillus mojavensis TaxID=72360 RepID=UPI002DB9A788|nr:aspartate aminotransferase family protein [Bacillus mojavensis]MEC1614597.1 aspartate aminotransferase family protein [Bacillus mojavensis]MEC1684555.1 aspartate aminotransferase family protein [Bacillus mojavensis]MEC1691026.1 aspartate aminotransferase family protein [Bacillus mojavensis]MEC1706604.1 aspartate aminotransferase family protein [Bacillus mojavensis]
MSSYLIKPELSAEYPIVSHAKGTYVYDQNGKKYLDGSSGAVTCNIGHGVDEVTEQLKEQLDKVSFAYRSQFTSEPAEQLAALLSEQLPGDLNWSFFVNSGSEAIETAMKIAIQYWQEKKQTQKSIFLSRWSSYHGITLGALSLSGFYERRYRFTHLLERYPALSAPHIYRLNQEAKKDFVQTAAEELETAIKRIGSQFIAGFVAETIIGAAGAAITPPSGYYERLKEVCRSHGVLFIADEVMTGLGRTGRMLATEHWNTVPDIAVLGKGLGAGYAPIAAAVVSDKILRTIKQGSGVIMSGHTYSAHPYSAKAALEVLRYVSRHGLIKQSEEKGFKLKKELEAMMHRSGIIGDVRGKGLLLGVEFVADKKTKRVFPQDRSMTQRIISEAKKRGLIVYPAKAGIDSGEGDAVIIAPPFTISDEEMEELISTFSETVAEVEKN